LIQSDLHFNNLNSSCCFKNWSSFSICRY